MRSGTIKGEVTVLPIVDKPKKGFGKASKLLSMNKVKQFGTRIKKLFKAKPEPEDQRETVYGVTTTTNTVEYTSVSTKGFPIYRDLISWSSTGASHST